MIPYEHMLGVKSDVAVEKEYGVATQTVRHHRVKRGISPAHSERAPRGIDWDTQPLGTVQPRVLAAMLGVHVGSVYAACYRRGISPTGWSVGT